MRARGLTSRGVAIQMLYRGWGRSFGVAIQGSKAAKWRARAHVRVATRPRLGRAWLATRPPVRHDTALSSRCARGLGAMRAQCAPSLGHVCVHCALDLVLTQCTILSHCLDRCSRTLFMNTVHEVFKKKKIYKIK